MYLKWEALDQIIAKKPAGIAVSVMNAEAYKASINKAIESGIPVVTFDSDSPASKRYTYLSTGNESAGAEAARAMAKAIGEKGNVGIIDSPGPENMNARRKGFVDTIKNEFPNIKIVQEVNAESSAEKAPTVLSFSTLQGPEG